MNHSQEQTIDIRSVLSELVKDGLLSKDDSNRVLGANRTREQVAMHPINYLGTQNLPNLRVPGKYLDEIVLTDWLASRTGHPMYHIDPMKVPVAESCAVMSFNFAKRHGLLCVDVRPDEVIIAVTEPYKTAWEAQIGQTVRQTIKKVIALPSEVERYRVEFYSLARSVSGLSLIHI